MNLPVEQNDGARVLAWVGTTMTIYSDEWFDTFKTGNTGALISKLPFISLRFAPMVPIALGAAFPETAAVACILALVATLLVGRVATPLTDVDHGASGLLLHRWPAKPRFVPWSDLLCVSVRFQSLPAAILVFHVRSHVGEDRYSLAFTPPWMNGPPLAEILKPLGELMPPDVVVERRRPSFRLQARLGAWQLVCGALGYGAAAVLFGSSDWRAALGVTFAGWCALVLVLLVGSHRPIAMSMGITPPEPRSIPRASRPWVGVLAARTGNQGSHGELVQSPATTPPHGDGSELAGDDALERRLMTSPYLLPIAGPLHILSWIALTTTIVVFGDVSSALVVPCVVSAHFGWISGAWGSPVLDAWYHNSGVRFRTFTGTSKFVPWDQFGYVRMRYYDFFSYRSIVFHVVNGATEDRYYVIAPSTFNQGRAPLEIFRDLASAAPASIVARGRRSSARPIVRALVWLLAAGLIGFVASAALGAADWRGPGIVLAVGSVTMLFGALTGKHDAVAPSDVLEGSVDVPRAFRDWVRALTDVAR